MITIFLLGCQLETSLTAQQEGIDGSRQTAITHAIEKISASVVGINVTQLKQQQVNPFFNPFWEGFFPYTRTFKVDNMGSGVLVSPDGYIITNTHVVDNAMEIVVTLKGGKSYDAQLVGVDNLTDIALLKIDDDNLPFAELGDSDKLIVGEWAIALGNPLGLFDVSHQPTATAGIISGVEMDFGLKEAGHVYQDMVQTDAAINPGNSGGPLVNMAGEVVGITSIKIATVGVEGMGYAISINTALPIIEDLIAVGYVIRPWLGVVLYTVDEGIADRFELAVNQGSLVTEVASNSPADKAGLEPGDVIVGFEDREIAHTDDLIQAIRATQIGQEVEITYWRSDTKSTTYAILIESPPPP